MALCTTRELMSFSEPIRQQNACESDVMMIWFFRIKLGCRKRANTVTFSTEIKCIDFTYNHGSKQLLVNKNERWFLAGCTGFKANFPILSVEVLLDNFPQNVRTGWKREGVQQQRHEQGSQTARLSSKKSPNPKKSSNMHNNVQQREVNQMKCRCTLE